MSLVSDFIAALKSKRVILATVTAAIVAVNSELEWFSAETLNRLTAIAGSLILGDSLRGTNPDK